MRTTTLLSLTVGALGAVRVDGGPCSAVRAEALFERASPIDVHVRLVDAPLMRQEAWTAARLMARSAQATLVVACRRHEIYANDEPLVVGVAFDDFEPGMDCGRRGVAALMARVDALDDGDAWTVKLEHLIDHLPQWRREQRCSTGNERVRAAFFWVAVTSIFFTARAFHRRRQQRRSAARASAARR